MQVVSRCPLDMNESLKAGQIYHILMHINIIQQYSMVHRSCKVQFSYRSQNVVSLCSFNAEQQPQLQ